MATVILTAAGAAIAGPIGGLIGAVIGQQIDAEIFKGPAREGPRLKELNVQTSSYGNTVPAIFGAMRVAGSVIWATDLIENRSKKSGGKGKPANVTYSYSVNMAVALSSRPLSRVGRIWADGNLIRGAAGDFKVPCTFRFYSGHDDQSADPLIASAEGTANTPAFRGIAYAMFEGLQLADFGNRIPSLTFEIFERDAQVPVIDIARAASRGLIISNSDEAVDGYALEGGDGRAGLSSLLATVPVLLRSNGDTLQMNNYWQQSGTSTSISISTRVKIISRQDNARYAPPEQYRLHKGAAPGSLSVRHYDPAREYQIGIQRSSRADTGRPSVQIELPATLIANAARRLADLQLLQMQRTQRGWSGHIAISADILRAGDWITEEAGYGSEHGSGGSVAVDTWQITEIEHLGLVSRIAARQAIMANPQSIAGAESGRSLPADDFVIGATQIVALDLPALLAVDPQKAQIAIVAAGNNKAWRSAALSLNTNGSLTPAGSTAAPAIIGFTQNGLVSHSPWLTDNSNQIIVKLAHDDMQLPAGPGNPLSSDAPYIWLAGEILRYGLAQYLGDARYRISRLVRGSNGTEAYISAHQIGDRFVLLEQGTLRLLDDISTAAGQQIVIEAAGIGDNTPATAQLNVAALAIKPLAPVHGRAVLMINGDIVLSWVRRARIDFGWQDGVDQPLAEDYEQYTVSIWSGTLQLAVIDTPRNDAILSAATIASWNIGSANNLQYRVKQIGKFAQSDALIFGQ